VVKRALSTGMSHSSPGAWTAPTTAADRTEGMRMR
jgi:hypothetical protein